MDGWMGGWVRGREEKCIFSAMSTKRPRGNDPPSSNDYVQHPDWDWGIHFSLKQTMASWRNGWFQSLERTCTRWAWRTSSYQTARKPSVTSSSQSRFCCVILILNPHPNQTRRGDSDSPIKQCYSPTVKNQGSSLGAARESGTSPGWERQCQTCSTSMSLSQRTLPCPGAPRAAGPFALVFPTARNDHEICIYQTLLWISLIHIFI